MGAGATTMQPATRARADADAEDPNETSLTSVADPNLAAMLASGKAADDGMFRPSDAEFALLLSILIPELRDGDGGDAAVDAALYDTKTAPKTLSRATALLTNTALTVAQASAVAAAVRGDDADRFAVIEFLHRTKIDEDDQLAFVLALQEVLEPRLTAGEIAQLQASIRASAARAEPTPARASRAAKVAAAARRLKAAAAATADSFVAAVVSRAAPAQNDEADAPDATPGPRRRSSLSRAVASLQRRLAAATPRARAREAKRLHKSIIAAVASQLMARAKTAAWPGRIAAARAQKKPAFDDVSPTRLELLVDEEIQSRSC